MRSNTPIPAISKRGSHTKPLLKYDVGERATSPTPQRRQMEEGYFTRIGTPIYHYVSFSPSSKANSPMSVVHPWISSDHRLHIVKTVGLG